MTSYRYEIEPRPLDLGGGVRLRLLEDDEEVGGGVFPLGEYPDLEPEVACEMALNDAQAEGDDWVDFKKKA
jgi:hypothetical protein